MKKLLIIAAVAVLLTGCASTQAPETIVPAQENTNKYQELANNMPVNETNNINKENNNMENTNQILPPAEQPNLLDKYAQAILKTNMGDLAVEFYKEDSPITVNNFMYLASQGFYDNTLFHRVIKDFMIQAGDPLSKTADVSRHGTGGPGYKFADEINNHKLVVGSLAMANSGPNTNGSQFFIVTAEATSWLDGKHTNFGKIIDGMDVVKQIENVQTVGADHPVNDVIIKEIILQ